MSLTAYPTLRLKLTMPQALKLQFLPAVPGSNAAAAAAQAQIAAAQAQAAADQAVAATANKVDRTGDVMTGFLTLNANPALPLHAATKQYVDAGGIPDGDKGDITVASSGTVWTIDANAVTYAKMQDVSAASKLLGRGDASAGDPQEITLGTNLAMSGTTLNASGGVTDGDKGDITVTSSGTVWTIDNAAVTYAKMQNVSATSRFIGRITGGAGDPEELTGTQATTLLDPFTSALKGVAPASGGGTTNFLRADGTWATPASGGAPTSAEYVVAALDGTLTNERILTNTATVIWDFSTPGQVKATATGGGGGSLPPDGTYTDIAVSGTGTIWTIRPAVVTYSKIQNISATNRLLGRITAGAGSTEELTGANVKTIVGSGDLTKTDDTNVTLTLGGTPAAALYNAVSLTLGWTGTLSVARGGLGVGTVTGLMQGNGTGAVTGITNSSTVGQVLRVTGASTYAWGALDLASANAVTGDLPFSSLTQGSARSVLGVTGNATADVASIQGAADQVLRVNGAGTALAFGMVAMGGIADNAVSYIKMQDVSAASMLLGRGSAAGAGDPEEITIGTGLTMVGTDLRASGSSSSASSVPQEGQLTFVSTTSLKFSPFRGNNIKINGAILTIPNAGIAGLANTGIFLNGTGGSNLAANTVYWVFAFSNSGTVTADFRTAATHATSATAGNEGVEIRTGDDTRTLIGLIRTNASSQFVNSLTQRFVRSWFNCVAGSLQNAFTVDRNTSSATTIEINSEIRCEFVSWANEGISFISSGSAYIATTLSQMAIGLDGTTQVGAGTSISIASYTAINAVVNSTAFTEGYHFTTLLAKCTSQLTCIGASNGTADISKCTLTGLLTGVK